jgi:hypothetical protein
LLPLLPSPALLLLLLLCLLSLLPDSPLPSPFVSSEATGRLVRYTTLNRHSPHLLSCSSIQHQGLV